MMERLDITDKKELIAVLAGEVLDALYWGTVTAPEDLYVRGTCCTTYTDEGQDRFNALHDLIETTINSYIVDEEMSKEQDCTCGLDEHGQWSDEVFDRFGCDCDEDMKETA